MNDLLRTIIIDNGSSLTKLGYVDEYDPEKVFPTVIGYKRNPLEDCKNEFIGNEAYSHIGSPLLMQYPVDRGIVTNWDDMEKIWHHSFDNELRVNTERHPIFITEKPMNPKINREKMMELMFEKFCIPAMCTAIDSVLSLFACGRVNGVVLESGDGVTHSVPIYEGHAFIHAVCKTELAGKEVTNYLMQMICEKGCDWFKSREHYIITDHIKYIKKKLCSVAFDYEQERQIFLNDSTIEKSYELPDGQIIKVGEECLRCPEALFQPSLISSEEASIQSTLHNSIMKCDADIQRDLYLNIALSGGNTMFPGFAERLTKEMNILVPNDTSLRIRADPDRERFAYIGGSILASLSSFQQMLISKEEYNESGSRIVHMKCF